MMEVRTFTATRWAPLGAELGEGPVWDGTLSVVDIFGGRLHRASSDGNFEMITQRPSELGAALPSRELGEYLLVERTGFSVLHADGVVESLLEVLSPDDDLRFNDAKCDPVGRCLAGTLSPGGRAAGKGALYRLDRTPNGWTTTVLLSGIGLSNGLGWSPSGNVFYLVDTVPGLVRCYDYDLARGATGAERIFIKFPPGTPDGLCVDYDGGVWVALWGRAEVHRYSPEGLLDCIVEVPVPNVTSCAFGGEDGATLFITTARTDLTACQLEQFPTAGDVFAVRPGHAGPPSSRWRPT